MRLLTWAVRLLLLFVVVVGCGTAMFVLYGRWLGGGTAGTVLDGGAAGLSRVERVYLQTILANEAEALAQPAGVGATAVLFTVSPGQSADVIAANLQSAGLLNDTELFLNYIRYHGLDSELEAGDFTLSPQLTIPEMAQTLTEAFAQEAVVRFIEGWRFEEMVDYLEETRPAKVSASQFEAIVMRRTPYDLSGYDFLASLPATASLEGFLFPDTYRLPVDADAAFLVTLMLNNFDNRVTPAMRQGFGVQGLSLHEAVTLASIVEREAVVADERPLIAGVFLNRLVQDISLDADPTVQYPLGYQAASDSWWKSPLSIDDLQRDTPYNTYIHSGLPPGPIANPGLSSLEAVANPTPSEFIFFVADCQAAVAGTHLFSITYEEHLAKVNNCR